MSGAVKHWLAEEVGAGDDYQFLFVSFFIFRFYIMLFLDFSKNYFVIILFIIRCDRKS